MIQNSRSLGAWWLVGVVLGTLAFACLHAEAQPLPPGRMSGQNLYVVGSTLMGDYTAAVIEHLTKNAALPPPIVSYEGSGRGIATFCAGTGLATPDIVATSRRILTAELDNCRAHGVTDIIEIQLGYEAAGIVSRRDDQDYPLTLVSMYRAIAAELPKDFHDFVSNRYQRWHEVDPSLPNTEIRLIIPLPSLGGRAFLEERMLQSACRTIPEIASIYQATERVRQCTALRKDGRILELDTPYAQNVVQTLAASPLGTLAVLPLRFITEHQEFLKVQPFDGVIPDYESVATRQYGFIRPLYFLVKKDHVKNYLGAGLVSGLREFITEVTRESTIGPNGYLSKLGLFPLDERTRQRVRRANLRLYTIER